MPKTSQKKPVALQVRLPAELHKRLEASARAQGHPLNSEVIDRLEKSFGLWGQLTLCVGDKWSTARLYKNQLFVDVGNDSPQDIAVLEFKENLEAFKDHFGVKK
jgi:hypothetical protein